MPSIQSIHYMFTAGQVPGPMPGSANSTRIEAQTQETTRKSLQISLPELITLYKCDKPSPSPAPSLSWQRAHTK